MAIAVCVVFAVVWFFLSFFSAFHCDGDGGAPYAARDSTVGRLCDARGSGPVLWLWLAGVLLTPVVILAGAIAAVTQTSRRVLVRSAALGFGILALVTLPLLLLPSYCSDEQAANGGDCETY